jgi:hypothetical protein
MRPRNIAIKLVLFLLLGAIVNVAVAWGCALWSAQESWESVRALEAPQRWPAYLERLSWPPPHSSSEHLELGLHRASIGVSIVSISGGDVFASCAREGPDTDKTFVSMSRRLFGIPARALSWEMHGVRAGPRGMDMTKAAHSAAGLRAGWNVSELTGAIDRGCDRRMPLMPLWPGFAINTIFYAAALWVIFAIPGTLKRLRRRAKGQCIHCGYDLRGQPAASNKCPECGKSA